MIRRLGDRYGLQNESLHLLAGGVGDHRVPRLIGEDRGPMIASVHRSPPAPTPIWAALASAA